MAVKIPAVLGPSDPMSGLRKGASAFIEVQGFKFSSPNLGSRFVTDCYGRPVWSTHRVFYHFVMRQSWCLNNGPRYMLAFKARNNRTKKRMMTAVNDARPNAHPSAAPRPCEIGH